MKSETYEHFVLPVVGSQYEEPRLQKIIEELSSQNPLTLSEQEVPILQKARQALDTLFENRQFLQAEGEQIADQNGFTD